MRFLGGVVALLIVAAGCTTPAEVEAESGHLHREYFLRHLPSVPVLPPHATVGGWPVDADGTVVRIVVHGDTPAAGRYSFVGDGTVVPSASWPDGPTGRAAPR